ncbi:MAG: Smr/MutS family protein [Sphingomonadales bacterium]|nr:Smr/MutS family protein [Sphingomonadales bacterium]MDE2568719.1 Smr/MutS family protein [Sphingomonadales bacterium]
MRPPRGLSPEEAALWKRVTDTVTPIHPARPARRELHPVEAPPLSQPPAPKVKGRVPMPRHTPPPPPASASPRPLTRHGLDTSWERKLSRGGIEPDVTIDLHGHGLDTAHTRLLNGLTQATAMGARVVLLVAGKHRPHSEHDQRGERRGAIRAKLLDWLAASPHADRIAAVRPAQQRHGGAGAVYIVLRRTR